MKRVFLLVILSSLFCSCSRAYKHSDLLERELQRLDAVLQEKEVIESEKEKKIEAIKKNTFRDTTSLSLYHRYDWLADEYRQYKVDSAMFYAEKALEAASHLGDSCCYNDAILDLAERYIVSGMYHDASHLLSKLDTTNLQTMDCPLYYFRMRALNEGLASVADEKVLKQVYSARETYYLNRIIEVIDTTDVRYTYIGSELLMNAGKTEEAIQLLSAKYNERELPINEKAIITYLMGQCYLRQKNYDEALIYFAKSARMDLLTPVYCYRSLCYLSALLCKTGDLNRAYKYMMRSIEDATLSQTYLSMRIISDMFPVIAGTYDLRMQTKNKQMTYLLIAISISLVILILVSLKLWQEKQRVLVAEKKTNEMNKKLLDLNERLGKYVKQLKESNTIKDLYLGRYLDMCSEYIASISRYRFEIRGVAKSGSLADVQTVLRSNTFIEQELERFYVTFDTTFLDLFPNFIDKLNELLQPDKQISINPKDGILTTELRIMALIRLGITDSVKISEFLRRSPSTIYNYRVKLRNAAINSRETFENQVMSIQ